MNDSPSELFEKIDVFNPDTISANEPGFPFIAFCNISWPTELYPLKGFKLPWTFLVKEKYKLKKSKFAQKLKNAVIYRKTPYFST
jgi:hypothetical protein